MMKLVFLGTGTSVGVPMIGCECPVCVSKNPRNSRRRSAIYLEAAGLHLVVDTPPEFREQALAYRIPRVDAVLITHSHADHVFGLDDMRRFNTIQDCAIPVYAAPDTVADLRRIFNYVGTGKTDGVYRPQLEFIEISAPFDIGGIHIDPLPVEHGPKTTFGYMFGAGGKRIGYVPDCHGMSDAAIEKLRGADIMALDALRHRPHATHLTVAASLELLRRIGARRSYIIHMCHELDHEETQSNMPAGVEVSYDGLVVRL